MTEANTQSAECLSRLTAELEAIKQEHSTLKNVSAMLVKNLEQLTTENARLKESRYSDDYKKHWRMTYAGQAMQAQMAQIDPDEDSNYKAIAYDAFCAADAMIEFIDEKDKL